ncbi:MAG: hypothetical protein ACR2NI_11110 [Pirellulales bacterium]
MINQLITDFLLKVERIIEDNPDIEAWCYSVSAGDKRRTRETVHSSQEYNSENDSQIIDELYEVLDRLVDEPVDFAWLELRAKGKSRVFCYVSVDVTNPEDQPPVLVDSQSEASAVMATQLVRVNDQLSSLMQSKDRLIQKLVVQHTETALSLTRLSTELEIRSQVESENNLSEALQSFAPLAEMALKSYLSQKASKSNEPQQTTPNTSNSGPVVPDLTEDDIEDVISKIEYVCTHSPERLTQDRLNRVVNAFTQSN